MTECLLCTETLTMKNVINTNCCTMPCCKDCFFKWTKVKNTCPCCRENIFCNSKENKEIMNMKELLSHRSNIISQVEEFNKIIPITGIIMTKLDGTAKGGILLALAKKYKLPIIALGLGEKEDDLQIFEAEKFAEAFTQTN